MAQTIALSGISNTPTLGSVGIAKEVVSDFQQMLYVTDLENVFFNDSEFAIPCQYYHKTLDSWVTYYMIYDDPHASFNFGGDMEFNTLKPQVRVRESALRHRVLKSDRVKVKSVEYFVDDYASDGVGVTTIFLRLK